MANLDDRLARLTPEQRALLTERLIRRRQESDTKGSLLVVNPEKWMDAFPLRDLQQAYWVGRRGDFDDGQVATHAFIEIDGPFDLTRLHDAWGAVLARHGMLRCRIGADGTQQITATSPVESIPALDLSESDPADAERALLRRRQRLAIKTLDDTGALYELNLTILPAGRVRIHALFDGLIVDGWSMSVILQDWARAYSGAELRPLKVSFRDVVISEIDQRKSSEYSKHKQYWKDRIADLPGPPGLPVCAVQGNAEFTFTRREWQPTPSESADFKRRAGARGLSLTGVLCQAFADVLSAWSGSDHFCINVPRFNRPHGHSDISELAGEFASLSILEVRNSEGTFEERARKNQAQLWNDLDHSLFSGIDVLREIAVHRDPAATGPIMPIVFTSAPKNTAGTEMSIAVGGAHLGQVAYRMNYSSQVWLDLHVGETEKGFHIEWDTVDQVFQPDLSQAMFEAFRRRVKDLARSDASWEKNLPATLEDLLPDDQVAMRTALRQNVEPIPWTFAAEPFLAQAAKTPSKLALVVGEDRLSYGELAEKSELLARRFVAAGVGPDVPVAVLAERGIEPILGALAVMRAGGAYLPLDTQVPTSRLKRIIKCAEPRIVLTQSWLTHVADGLEGVELWPIDLDETYSGLSSEGHESGPLGAKAVLDGAGHEDLAYILFTSGSTGEPKGVMVEQGGLVNALFQTVDTFRIGVDDCVLGLTPLHHDLSVFDIFGTLGAGGTLVVVPEIGARDPALWSQLIVEHSVTIWNSVPAMMQMLLEYVRGDATKVSQNLRYAFLGGDWIPIDLPGRLEAVAPGAQVVSTGGPTETTLWNIWHPVEDLDPDLPSVPYGKPIANTQYYALSSLGHDCPNWVPGELCVAGPGVARGYLGDSELTEQKFFLHSRIGKRLYRTGDLGRFRPDGTLEFLGRYDAQVKVQGYRIELGDVEQALLSHRDVSEAVVLAMGDTRGERHLVAFVVGPVSSDTKDIREHAETHLAPSMVPGRITVVDGLPLSRNGKVDRVSLARLATEKETNGGNAPSSELVGILQDLVAKILGIDAVHPDRPFTEYGANSIDMVRLGNRLEETFGRRPRMAARLLSEFYGSDGMAEAATMLESAAPPGAGLRAREGDPPGGLTDLLSRIDVIHDPCERDRFKASLPGVRRDLTDCEVVSLDGPRVDEALRDQFRGRRSHRQFSLSPVPARSFGYFLSALRSIDVEGTPKWLYASPGGLYPTQMYLHIKPGRVEGLDHGAYYYHPRNHSLVKLDQTPELGREIHVPFVNAPIYDQAAFSIFLVADLAAIAPGYGELCVRFATMEAGAMAHHLECAAASQGIGLCQIGSVEFAKVRGLFGLGEDHALMHSLVGGQAVGPSEGSPQELLQRIQGLSDEQAKALVAATEAARRVRNGD